MTWHEPPPEPIHITTSEPPRTLPLHLLERDANGRPIERRLIGGAEVIVHFAVLPAEDKTVIDGIPCTSALRTVIDVATEIDVAELDHMLAQALGRRLFTVDEALVRLGRTDMLCHPGAPLVVRALARRLR